MNEKIERRNKKSASSDNDDQMLDEPEMRARARVCVCNM